MKFKYDNITVLYLYRLRDVKLFEICMNKYNIWRPPRLSELTQMIFNTGLTHLGSGASI